MGDFSTAKPALALLIAGLPACVLGQEPIEAMEATIQGHSADAQKLGGGTSVSPRFF